MPMRTLPMRTLAVVGAGQLGSRHLQALAKLKGKSEIFVVDPSAESLATAKARFEGLATDDTKVSYLQDFKSLPSQIDVAIVATNSGPRRRALESLLTDRTVSFCILEKVLFPNFSDYTWAKENLDAKSMYVNCPIRVLDWGKDLRQKLQNVSSLNVRVSGSGLGLACNSIHYLDFFNFLTGKTEYSVFTDLLLPKAFESKRPGYYEAYGTLNFQFAPDFTLSLQSFASGDVPTKFDLISEEARYIVDFVTPNSGVIQSSSSSSGWKWSEQPFAQKFQSELTHTYVESLLENGTCGLTPLATSMELHLPLVHSFASFFSKHGVPKEFDCPIS